MNDPRAKLYSLLDSAEGNDELKNDTKSYFEHLIGRGTVSATATAELDALKSERDALKLENDTYKTSQTDAETGLNEMRATLKSLTESARVAEEEKTALIASTNRSTALDVVKGKLSNVDPIVLNGIVSSIADNGYSLDGKTYVASNVDGVVGISIDGVATDIDTGVKSLMDGGIQGYSRGVGGGGAPLLDSGVQPPQSMEDAVNGWNK